MRNLRHRLRFPTAFSCLGLLGLVILSASCSPDEGITSDYRLPHPEEWTDRGVALSAGPPGSWDVRLRGMISPAAMLKRNGTYFLYYIGADGDRSTDGGPRHRALGVATSTDGIEFEKHSRNPILRHLPNLNEEEGIYSAVVVRDEEDRILLYYSALDAGDATSESVDSDVRLAVSTDWIRFDDRNDVLFHADKSVWGYGDELFPIGAFRANETWYLYYIAKGLRGIFWDLGMAWGQAPDSFHGTRKVFKTDRDLIGGCTPVDLGGGQLALFLLWGKEDRAIEAHVVSAEKPWRTGPVRETYRFDGRNTLIHLDRETGTWFLYSRVDESDEIRVWTAPMVANGTPGG